jgi:hypothetical protein
VGVEGLKREDMADIKREAVVMVLLGVTASEAVLPAPVALRRALVGVVSGVVPTFGAPFAACRPSEFAAPALPLSQPIRPPPPRWLSGVLPLLLPSPV